MSRIKFPKYKSLKNNQAEIGARLSQSPKKYSIDDTTSSFTILKQQHQRLNLLSLKKLETKFKKIKLKSKKNFDDMTYSSEPSVFVNNMRTYSNVEDLPIIYNNDEQLNTDKR